MVGTNSRMSELDCASLLVKTRYLSQWQSRRTAISKHYIERFKNANLRCLIDNTNIDNHAHHKFVIEVDDRDLLATPVKVVRYRNKNTLRTTVARTQCIQTISRTGYDGSK
jgi:dTDP-4-amino-4,6-dideoxygalactose transaminase